MLSNVIDRRTNNKVAEVDGILEPSWHHNHWCNRWDANATQFPEPTQEQHEYDFGIQEMNDTTIHEIVKKCETYDFAITAFLYDKGSRPGAY